MALNEKELDVAKEIINIGLCKAADSMAFFTKDKVLIEGVDVEVVSVDSIDTFSEKPSEEDIVVLSTSLKGEMQGVCHLVFSVAETEKIFNVSLPKSILEDEDKMKVMGDAILQEMDNIIAASVVTQFSNVFDYMMYGDVPRIHKMKKSELDAFIRSDEPDLKSCLFFKCDFSTNEIDIKPEFIWLMDDKFEVGVKKVTNSDELLEKVNGLK
jgi:chemotaxis protein CheY-P-specific phosphatase CheC